MEEQEDTKMEDSILAFLINQIVIFTWAEVEAQVLELLALLLTVIKVRLVLHLVIIVLLL